MKHIRIRLLLLAALCRNYYDEGYDEYFNIDSIIKKAGLSNENHKYVEGDLHYLIDKELIDTKQVLGTTGDKILIKINVTGIDMIDEFLQQSLKVLVQSDTKKIRRTVNEILGEDDRIKRTSLFLEYFKKNPDVFSLVATFGREILKTFFGSGVT